MILDLNRQGLSVSAIARRTGRDPKTVRKYIARRLEPPVYGPRQVSRPGKLLPFVDYIRERLADFPDLTATRLLRKIRERGYGGAYSPVKRFVAAIRPNEVPRPFETRFETPHGCINEATVDDPWDRPIERNRLRSFGRQGRDIQPWARPCGLARARPSADNNRGQAATSWDHQTWQRLSQADADPWSASGTTVPGQGKDAYGRMAARIVVASAPEHGRRGAGGEDGQYHLGGIEKRAPLRSEGYAVGMMIEFGRKGTLLAGVVRE